MVDAGLRVNKDDEGKRWDYDCKLGPTTRRVIQRLTIVQKILFYSSATDRLFLVASFVASVCAGATLPLMNIVFGK